MAWKLSVAMIMLWLCNQAWGVEFSALPLWRQGAGMVLLLVFVEYFTQAAEIEDDGA